MNPAPPVMTVLNVGTPVVSCGIGFPVSGDHFIRILDHDTIRPGFLTIWVPAGSGRPSRRIDPHPNPWQRLRIQPALRRGAV